MNLLEKAMRQKTLRASQTAIPHESALLETNRATPARSTRKPYLYWLSAALVLIALAVAISIRTPSNNIYPPVTSTKQTNRQFEFESKSPPRIDERQNIEAFVNSWARAWSAREADKYLSAYAPEFEPANGLTRAAWEKQRRHRLGKYKKIEITLSNLAVSVEKDVATAEFIQSFEADGFSETGLRKRLDLKQQGTRWMIVRETSS